MRESNNPSLQFDLYAPKVVFGLDEAGIIDIAIKGAECCKANEKHMGDTKIRYEYSPESLRGRN